MLFIYCYIALLLLYAGPLLLLVLSMSHSATDALACKGVFSAGILEEIYDIECTGPNFEDPCYVMYTDYRVPHFDTNYCAYGCITKVSLKCDKSFHEHGVDDYYCSCMDAHCNDKHFAAAKCGGKMNVPAENMVVPKYDVIYRPGNDQN